jgi:hypothetical protein
MLRSVQRDDQEDLPENFPSGRDQQRANYQERAE